MFTIFLTEEDLTNKEQFPVVALINEASNTNIIEFINNVIKGVGGGYNYSSYSFWEDLDDYDKLNTPKFDGLWVGDEAGEETIVSLKELRQLLEILYIRLASTDFSEMSELRRLIDMIDT